MVNPSSSATLPTGVGISFPLRLRRLGGCVTTPTSSYGQSGLWDCSYMDLREAAATSGVPRNTILVLTSVESLEEEEYRWVNDLAWWKQRGSTAIEDVNAWCRLYLADAGGTIQTPQMPNWKP